jgi:hypothetical protein
MNDKQIIHGTVKILFSNSHSGEWSPVQLGPLGSAATDWPIVACPGWLWWRIWWNEDWQGKPKYSEKTRSSATLSATNPTWPDPGSNPGCCGGKPATDRLSYGAGSCDSKRNRQFCHAATNDSNERRVFLCQLNRNVSDWSPTTQHHSTLIHLFKWLLSTLVSYVIQQAPLYIDCQSEQYTPFCPEVSSQLHTQQPGHYKCLPSAGQGNLWYCWVPDHTDPRQWGYCHTC